MGVGGRILYAPVNALSVVALEPGRYLVIGHTAWALQDLGDGRTLLVTRM